MGTIFRIDRAGKFRSLHSFSGRDGELPVAPLELGDDGALYGTSAAGGASGAGTVFKLDSAGEFSPLHSFDFGDGAHPYSALAPGSDGALYGTTRSGGASDFGTVYRVDTAGKLTPLHSLRFSDGAYPSADLVSGSDGALYGVTPTGGELEAGDETYGTVFEIDRGGRFTSLHSFRGTDGEQPVAALVLGNDGNLYGTAPGRGPGGGGVVYYLVPDTDADGIRNGLDNCDLIANPNQVDQDEDGRGDPCDNCPHNPNARQEDTGGIRPWYYPDGIGDPCQCGDVDGTGTVTSTDGFLIAIASLSATNHATDSSVPQPTFLVGRCNVTAPGPGECTATDALFVNRGALGLRVPNLDTHFKGLCRGEALP